MNLPSWGISIIGGEDDPDGPGIYISEINDNSIAQAGNLLPQDRIVEVNGENTRVVDHDVSMDFHFKINSYKLCISAVFRVYST